MSKRSSSQERQAFYKRLLAASQPHLRPLIAAARDGAIVLGLINQHSGSAILSNQPKPVITIIGDDQSHALGIAAFDRDSIAQIARRANLAIVNAWALDPELYILALAMATALQWNVLFIETRLLYEQTWISEVEKAHPGITFLIVSA